MGNKEGSEVREGRDSLGEIMQAESKVVVERALRTAFSLRRPLLVSEIARTLREVVAATGKEEQANSPRGEWTAIESLSALRRVVGGRFSNLRERWLEAGFPLKEKGGEGSSEDIAIDPKGWARLSAWIMKQGFESRTAESGEAVFFEIRSISKRK